ncbi:hypothetical protein Ahy_B09g096394 isoform B [Arachis hypogaea]|uniref:PPM-type phosphatase domain-containing protein n=1 Tax=Arachis hypogaea TaxID=3818 RepID=A0A444XKI8_ARAHY|nr:hypothetical protein Ahy_B09g096394 isoform B [Arachis hypogaea]
MGHLSSMFNGLAKSLAIKKGRNSERCSGREAAEAMAKEAKKNEFLLCSSGTVSVDGSNNFASVFSKRGKKGINQDCCIVWEEFGCQEDTIFCGIFDGHGPWGHFVAKRVRESMPPCLLCNWQETLSQTSLDLDPDSGDADVEAEKMQNCFNIWKHSYLKTCAAIDRELEQNRKIDSFFSGTTALSIVRQGELIVIANVGDSRAVLATTSDDGSLVPIQLTVDFKPNLPQEAARILECQGRVFCLEDEPGVHRVWLPDEVTQWNVTTRDQFVVLATDGVWDVISNEEAVEIVSSTAERGKSAKRLVECAKRSWKRKRGGIAMDDISAICLFFHSPCNLLDNQLATLN